MVRKHRHSRNLIHINNTSLSTEVLEWYINKTQPLILLNQIKSSWRFFTLTSTNNSDDKVYSHKKSDLHCLLQ